ncbi:hypothetical protein C8A03DRAFT_33697 [Achaetomium macrosporum]|uniref:Uncharacterized protein n=1 Tax=Achaetomium macrosporum TaxID=79813 RepID=A0AAN7CA86_9PEZI|nr:hypothetical protein C8A03DRAFT_33697 [Achaetomium macrosporum]
MSQNGGDASKASPPSRPRHQITRSISEISSPIRLHRHQSHRATRETERETRTPVAQSATPVAQSRRSYEWSRSEAVTPNLSPNASRRTSILYASADEVMPTTKAPKDNGLAKEQQKAAARESGLQRSLVELESFAGSTTKRLDDTYHSLLEKISTLQSTVAALKELADLSRQVNNNFSAEAEELVTDIGSQLDSFGQFDDQQRRIESLQDRIHAGRKRIRSLSERVDAVSERIENWERADREWQEKTRKRLKTVWIVVTVAIFFMLSLFVGSQYVNEGLEEASARGANKDFNTLRDVPAANAELLWSLRATGPQGNSKSQNSTEPAGASSTTADMLRMFNEL